MKNIKRSMTSKCSIKLNNTNYIKNMLRNINSNRNTTLISLSIFKIIIFLTDSNSLFTIFSNFNFLLFLRLIRLRLNSFNTNNSIFLQCKFENIADKSIKAMNIAVKCSDVSHQELANVGNIRQFLM